MFGYVGLGSNVGDREAHLRAGLLGLARGGVRLLAVSSLWETEPVGGAGPGWFLNMAARIATDREPDDLLDLCLAIERGRGRVRGGAQQPRPLDLDLLHVEGRTSAGPRLVLPHPRMWDRRFVLAPLEEIAPSLVRAATGRTVGEELASLADPHAVRRVGTLDWPEGSPVYSPAP